MILSRSTWSQSLWKAVGASDNYSSQAALAGGESISSISIIEVLATLEVLVVLVVLVAYIVLIKLTVLTMYKTIVMN